MENSLIPLSFQLVDDKYVAYLPVDEFIKSKDDPETKLKTASIIYRESINDMRSIIADMAYLRTNHTMIPARKIWQLGNVIFELTEKLEILSFQIDNLYYHLERDLKVKRKWLEKVIILRRYIPIADYIPEKYNWAKLEKGTKGKAQTLLKGSILT